MTPQTGDTVRLVGTKGVASPAMQAQVGRTGTVIGARREGEILLVHARFPTADGVSDQFWLKPGEYELSPAPVVAPTAPKERTPMDFATTVQAALERLAQEDGRIAEQMADLARRRGDLGRERRALEAARTAYRRVVEGVGGAPPKETAAVSFVRRWAAAHGGTVVLAEALPAAERAGVCPTAEQVRDRVTWAVRRYGERVGKGIYRLEAAS